MQEVFGRALCVVSIGENLPDHGSSTDLDPQERDAPGLTRARIHTQRSARHLAGRARRGEI